MYLVYNCVIVCAKILEGCFFEVGVVFVKVYNTYTREKETFSEMEQGKISMYVCGPTVYDFIHIGNARPVIFFDVVNRYFKYLGYDVNYVSNVTDVDDKIIAKAMSEGTDELEVSQRYLGCFLDDCRRLNVLPVDAQPLVTENMDEIVAFIGDLVDGGFAYAVDGDVYFRVNKVAEYGKLSGKKVDDLVAGARVEANVRKESPLDFTLWKKTSEGIVWDSPWGSGRPGWHTECVVMIDEAFGGKIDIHGGGADLQFPHHENEIAQSVCRDGHSLANYWMHVGRLALDGEKMSKSLGNVIRLRDLLDEWDANVFRLFMLSSHYRMPISFSYEVLEGARAEWSKIVQAYDGLFVYLDLADGFGVDAVECPVIRGLMDEFLSAMDDDFNTANAISSLYGLVKEVNKIVRAKGDAGQARYAIQMLEQMFSVLGFVHGKDRMSDGERDLVQRWEDARSEKDFALADELRAQLKGILF